MLHQIRANDNLTKHFRRWSNGFRMPHAPRVLLLCFDGDANAEIKDDDASQLPGSCRKHASCLEPCWEEKDRFLVLPMPHLQTGGMYQRFLSPFDFNMFPVECTRSRLHNNIFVCHPGLKYPFRLLSLG